MKKEFIGIFLLILALATVLSMVQGQPAPSEAQTRECPVCDKLSAIIDEMKIANNNKAGEVVTGMAVLKDGQPGATGHWLDMPIGTCDVTLFSEAGGLSHASDNYSYSMAEAGADGNRNSYFCSSNGNSWTDCTKTMTFDEQFHFAHMSGPGDVIYLQIAYQCTLT